MIAFLWKQQINMPYDICHAKRITFMNYELHLFSIRCSQEQTKTARLGLDIGNDQNRRGVIEYESSDSADRSK